MLRGEPKGQASPVPTGRPSSLLYSLSEDQDPGRGRTARPPPRATGPHWPSGAHHLSLGRRERPAHREAAEVSRPGHDHRLDQIGGMGIGGLRIRARLPAYLRSPLSNAEATEARLAPISVLPGSPSS